MDWNQIEGNWKQLKGKALEKWGQLTNDELDQVRGNKDQLAGKIQAKYGKTKEEAEKEVEEWSDSL